MGGKGPNPKPSNIRQRRNKKTGATTLQFVDNKSKQDTKKSKQKESEFPELQNPDGREFHPLTISWWNRIWKSPMAGEYLPTDIDGLARLALLVDNYYKFCMTSGAKELLGEIRLQEARFGLSPVDRSRLQWEVQRGEEAEGKRNKPGKQNPNPSKKDPRGILGVAK